MTFFSFCKLRVFMIKLKNDETLEDLRLKGLRMIQKRNGFRFGEDSVLLANYVSSFYKITCGSGMKIADMGCNCGSISLLLSGKFPNSNITGIEIDRVSLDVFKRNIKLNNLSHRIDTLLTDWERITKFCKPGTYDCVVSNPPYHPPDEKSKNTDYALREEPSTMESLMKAAHYLLKPKGFCFFVYKTNRLPDVIFRMKSAGLEPKRIRTVHPFEDKASKAFLVAGQKDVKSGGFILQSPLIVYKSKNEYTKETRAIYGNSPKLSEEELYENITRE